VAKDLIRLMQTLFLPAAEQVREACWRPAADVHRTRDGWRVKLDLAGIHPDDVSVTVSGQQLTVRGVRKDWCLGEGCSCYVMEISYSHFERTLTIPCDLERAQVSADYREGMLLIRIETTERHSEEANP
jgi:HSP20 family protein